MASLLKRKKRGSKGCKFTIDSAKDEWKYQECQRDFSGTQVKLKLNDHGKAIVIKETLEKYLLCPSVDVYYRESDGDEVQFMGDWEEVPRLKRFLPNFDVERALQFNVVTEGSIDGATYILVQRKDSWTGGLVLFNHGIFVGIVSVDCLANSHYLYVNLSAPLVDLHISREAVVVNEKLHQFLYNIFCHIFKNIEAKYLKDSPSIYFSSVNSIVESRYYMDSHSLGSLFSSFPVLRSFFDTALFPCVFQEFTIYRHIKDIVSDSKDCCYQSSSLDFSRDIPLLILSGNESSMFVNPYRLPNVRDANGRYVDVVKIYTSSEFECCSHLTFSDMLLNTCSQVDIGVTFQGVKFGTFQTQFKPLVIYCSCPCFKHSHSLGAAYFGNIALFKRLIDVERHAELLRILESCDSGFRSVILENEPEVLVDVNDLFISALVAACKIDLENHALYFLANRYFKFLSFLPLVFANSHSLILFIEVLDSLEQEISVLINHTTIPPIQDRLFPDFAFYLSYYGRHGIPVKIV